MKTWRPRYLTLPEFINRLDLLGWRPCKSNGSHISFAAPASAKPVIGGSINGKGYISFSINNYEKNFFQIARDVYRQFPDIKQFLFQNKFSVPDEFSIEHQNFLEVLA